MYLLTALPKLMILNEFEYQKSKIQNLKLGVSSQNNYFNLSIHVSDIQELLYMVPLF